MRALAKVLAALRASTGTALKALSQFSDVEDQEIKIQESMDSAQNLIEQSHALILNTEAKRAGLHESVTSGSHWQRSVHQ